MDWFDKLKEDILVFFTSRLTILTLLFIGLGGILLYRMFDLQIVQGQEYLDKFILQTEKTRSISSSRGSIRDCNGVVLAYDELAYYVKIEDVYESGRQKNAKMNETIYNLIKIVEKNGDSIITDFDIYINENGDFTFRKEGSKLLRFLADVYGQTYVDNLEDWQREATPNDVMNFLGSKSDGFAIGDYEIEGDTKSDFIPGKGYTQEEFLQMVTIRYAMKLTSFRKYIGTTVATDISDKTVAAIMENNSLLPGVTIETGTVRRYVDSMYFSHILGYTGKIDSDDLITLNEKDLEEGGTGERYNINDIVGRSGIEYYMETTLQGTKGYEKVVVDNMGRVISILDRKEALAGNDVILTIDSELQKAAYNTLEQRIAGIVADKIINAKEYKPGKNDDNSDIKIPIYDVYYAVINNSVVDINRFTEDTAGETERAAHAKYQEYKAETYNKLLEELKEKKTVYNKLTLEYKVYQSYIVTLLKEQGILNTALIDKNDETQVAWATEEVISLHEYLNYCISQNWIDVSRLKMENKYSDSTEIYNKICDYIITIIDSNQEFQKRIYRFMIKNDVISGKEICKILCEQNVIDVPLEEEQKLFEGDISAYTFMMNRIRNLEITPAQLALDPCNGSMVITDVNTGDVLACVTYPGYDLNKMANSVDAQYFAKLLSDKSNPLINYATTYSAAPGSTYKMVSATAALCEGIETLSSKTDCVQLFDLVSPPPSCWKKYGHGKLDITGAICNSCNYYFYNVGYKLATASGSYVAEDGLSTLAKYAAMYGLTEKTGIEIDEAMPHVSDELPIPSAIGQGTNTFTSVGLSRYIAAIANGGNVYELTLLDSVQDSQGNVLKTFDAALYNDVELPPEYWNALRTGMRQVVEKKTYFSNLAVEVAGKTGTAEQISSRPNHALFVCYAPYDNPEIAVTTRIPFGYSSDYAAQTTRDIIAYYYGIIEEDELVTGTADAPDAGISNNEI